MYPELFTIGPVGAGDLSTMTRPGGGDWLADELHGLAATGVDVLVSLLTDAENTELGLEREAELAQEAGLAFLRLPMSRASRHSCCHRAQFGAPSDFCVRLP